MVSELPVRKPRAPTKRRQPGRTISLATECAAKTLYVVKGFTPKVIGPQVGLKASQVSALAKRRNWASERDGKIAQLDDRMQQSANRELAREQAAIGTMSADLALQALERTGRRLQDDDDKGAQMLSNAARNLVDISRRTRGLDRISAAEQPTGLPLTLFLIQGERPARPEKNVTPAVVTAIP